MNEPPSGRALPFTHLPGWLVATTLLGFLLNLLFGTVTIRSLPGGMTHLAYSQEIAWDAFTMAAGGFSVGLLAQLLTGLRRFRVRWLIEVMTCIALIAYPLNKHIQATDELKLATEQYRVEMEEFRAMTRQLETEMQKSE